jgi:apolipoprotein N-acyltransferase
MKQALQNLRGYKKYLALFGLGALSVLSLPPLGIFPVLLVSIPGLIWLSQSAPTKFKSFLGGWAFGAGYFIFGLYWISAALFVDIHAWGWVMPFSLVVGPALLGIFYGLIPLFAHRWREMPSAHVLMFTASWAVIEYARGHILTGFPWNFAGQAWEHALPVLQTVSLTGIYGLTLLTVLWAATPVVYKQSPRLARVAAVSFVLLALFGFLRMAQNPTAQNGDTVIRIVQANIPQTLKWDPDEDWRNLERHIELSASPEREENPPPRFIVWPESASRHDFGHFPEIGSYVGQRLPRGSIGVIGNIRVTADKNEIPSAYHNSLTALGRKGEVLATYDKHHLVPFGEYLPFRKYVTFEPLALALSGIGDFTPGDGPKTLHIEGMPAFSPLICYEAIFPRAVIDAKDRPAWLVNVTNDGWYGMSAGPFQHMAISRIRAIEEGLPLVRAANTGISAVVDPVGRTVARLGLGEKGRLDSILPAPLPPTLYAAAGDSIFFALLLIVGGAGIFIGRKKTV